MNNCYYYYNFEDNNHFDFDSVFIVDFYSLLVVFGEFALSFHFLILFALIHVYFAVVIYHISLPFRNRFLWFGKNIFIFFFLILLIRINIIFIFILHLIMFGQKNFCFWLSFCNINIFFDYNNLRKKLIGLLSLLFISF